MQSLITSNDMWIARDKDERLYTYSDKPIKSMECWSCRNGYTKMYLITENWLFPEVKWEDDEPTEIILKK